MTPEAVSRLLRMPLLATMGDQRGLDEAINLGAGPARSRRRGVSARAARTGVAVAGDVPAGGCGMTESGVRPSCSTGSASGWRVTPPR